MVTKFVLRPLPLPCLFPPRLSPIPLPLLSTSAAPNHQTLSLVSYGPSLHKGQKPPPSLTEPDQNDDVIDRESFARVFHISALRVPADKCFALESRLRGHLLNWPRVRNIARVPGDDIEPELKHLLSSGSDSDPDSELVALNRRIYGKAEGDGEELSPVLYRDLLARKFDSKGFVRFRNLAKLSRPRKKRRERRERGESGRNVVAEVELIEDGDGGDMSGLLGVVSKKIL